MADRFTRYRQIGNAHLKVTGLGEWLNYFNGLAEDGIPSGAEAALTRFGQRWWQRADAAVHVITGKLKASCTGPDVILHRSASSVEVSLEYDTDYAAIEHHRDGAHAWLQISWNESEPEFGAAVIEAISESLAGL